MYLSTSRTLSVGYLPVCRTSRTCRLRQLRDRADGDCVHSPAKHGLDRDMISHDHGSGGDEGKRERIGSMHSAQMTYLSYQINSDVVAGVDCGHYLKDGVSHDTRSILLGCQTFLTLRRSSKIKIRLPLHLSSKQSKKT